jgi:outer membrane receptor protein involved in Fe transport
MTIFTKKETETKRIKIGLKKFILLTVIALAITPRIKAADSKVLENDSTKTHFLDEVIVTSSYKETNTLSSMPASVSLLSPAQLAGLNIIGVKDLSAVIPNLFIPDYGSRMTVPIYIRGMGERSTGQTVGLYVDNAPYPDKSAFDFNFTDIQRIEVLRGPQGTLFGRNAMGGIIRIYTNSPLDGNRTQATLTGGTYGLFRANALVSRKTGDNFGVSVSGYYDRHDGYFNNTYNNQSVDAMDAGGGRIRADWKLNNHWTAQLSANYDYTKQGAFPYGAYVNGKIDAPNYNEPGRYDRQVVNGNFNLNYTDSQIIFNASTSYQYLDDDVTMDVDYSPASMFVIRQKQYLNAYIEEMTIRSNTTSNYQWLFGLYGFVNDMNTHVTTSLGQNAITSILQPAFTGIHDKNPNAPLMTIKDSEIPIPGQFNTPVYGGAIFHQSTFNNLFVEGLSLTAGVRLDYEKVHLDYDTYMNMDLDIAISAGPKTIHVDSTLSTTLQGEESMNFTEILPKVALKYELNSDNYVYALVSNGYKAGGYNIQSFADIVQGVMREKYDRTYHAASVGDLVPYQPEYSWSYEVGYKGEPVKNRLYVELAAFYIDIDNIQITDFVESGQGRILKNAGTAKSMGFDLGIKARITDEFQLNANYGLTKATFKDYKIDTINYTGNAVPFVPQNTLSLTAVYSKQFTNESIDSFSILAQYNAAGKIYWTEANDINQKFYGLLDLKVTVTKGIFSLSLWTKNALNTDYAAFYFESMQHPLAQKGKPLQAGVDVSIKF